VKKYKIIVPVISVCVIIALLLTFRMSLAYLMDAERKDNIITIGKVDLELDEGSKYQDNSIVAAGDSVFKAPQLTNTGTEDEYVFLRIAVPVKDVTLLYEEDIKGSGDVILHKEGTKVHTTTVDNHTILDGNGKAHEEIYRMIATGTNPQKVTATDEPQNAPCLDFGYNAGHIKNANDANDTNKDGWVYLKRELNKSIAGETGTYDLYYFGYNRRLQYNSDQTEKAKTIPLFDEVQLKSFIDEELIPAADTTKSNQETHILVLGYAIQADSLDKGNAGDLNAIERDAYLNQVQLTKIFGIVERKAGEA